MGAFGSGGDYFCQWCRIYADGAKGCGRAEAVLAGRRNRIGRPRRYEETEAGTEETTAAEVENTAVKAEDAIPKEG